MTYDNTDTNADGTIDSDINTNSLKIGDDWEQRYDANNNRLLIEYTPNGNQFELNEDGSLKPLDGDIDLGGVNSITNASSVNTGRSLTDEVTGRDFGRQNPQFDRQGGQSVSWNLRPHPDASNPMLEGSDWEGSGGTDFADPFVIYDYENDLYAIFGEILASSLSDPIIAVATASSPKDFKNATIETALNVPDASASPWVEKVDGTWYMAPDPGSGANEPPALYRSNGSPWYKNWERVETIVDVVGYGDPLPFYWPSQLGGDDMWYLFLWEYSSDDTLLYYSDSLTGGWTEHPDSPLVTGENVYANGGRPQVKQGVVDRPGKGGFILRLLGLDTNSVTTEKIQEEPAFINSDYGWNSDVMHHCDYVADSAGHPDIAVLDGNDGNGWTVGFYTHSELPLTGQRIYDSSSTEISGDGTYTTIGFDTIQYSNVDRKPGNVNGPVAPFTGHYDIHSQIELPVDSETEITVRLRQIPGSKDFVVKNNITVSPQDPYVDLNSKGVVERNTHVEVQVFQNSGLPISTQTGNQRTFIEMNRFW